MAVTEQVDTEGFNTPAAKAAGTLYEPNTTEWEPGDFVIHDSDYKGPHMLMIVLGVENGLYVTRYVDPAAQGKDHVYKNPLRYLHDPRRFWNFPLRYQPPTYAEVLNNYLNSLHGGEILRKWDAHFLRLLVRLEREGRSSGPAQSTPSL